MTDRRWELQQKGKELGTEVLQKLWILNLTTFIYGCFHTVITISNSAYSMLLEMKDDNDSVGGLTSISDLKLLETEKSQIF